MWLMVVSRFELGWRRKEKINGLCHLSVVVEDLTRAFIVEGRLLIGQEDVGIIWKKKSLWAMVY